MDGVHYDRLEIIRYEERFREQVLALAREMHAESVSHRHMPLDEKKLLNQLNAANSAPDNIYFRIAVRGDEVIGGFFGTITVVYFGQESVARDLAWFVKRSRRGSRAAVELIRDWESWARTRGVNKFMLGQSTGVNVETTTALYEHLGYTVIGVNTYKEG